MPRPATGSQASKPAVKASGNEEKQETENAAQKYELGKRVVGEQPLRTEIEREPRDHAKQKEGDSGAVVVVWGGTRCQKSGSAVVQKT